MKIALLHDAGARDGRADEQDALVQLECIGDCLRADGHTTVEIPVGLDLAAAASALSSARPDLAVNFVESIAGHGRLIHLAPALLDALRIPYTGVRTQAMMVTSDKLWTKRELLSAQLRTPAWLDGRGGSGGELRFPGRYIIKSVWEDASLGLDDDSVVDSRSLVELRREIDERSERLGGEAFAEAWIDGREFNLSLLEVDGRPRVLPVAEMCFVDFPVDKPKMVGYRAKWAEDSFEYHNTVRRFDLPDEDASLLVELERVALASWQRFGLSGYARVDFRVDGEGAPWVLELNANPCLSPDAGFAAAAERAGMDLRAISRHLVEAALRVRAGAMKARG